MKLIVLPLLDAELCNSADVILMAVLTVEDRKEFIAADTVHIAILPEALANDIRSRLDVDISLRMTIGVVDLLEVVDIEMDKETDALRTLGELLLVLVEGRAVL